MDRKIGFLQLVINLFHNRIRVGLFYGGEIEKIRMVVVLAVLGFVSLILTGLCFDEVR